MTTFEGRASPRRTADGRKIIDILILVEHVDRELDVAALIAARIATMAPHLRLRIANFYTEAQSLIRGLAPRVVVTPFFYAVEDKVLRDYVAAWPRSTFFNLAWEQILYGAQQKLKRPRDDFARLKVNHLAWSEWFTDYLKENGTPVENVAWLGHPLYDMFDPSMRGYFPQRRDLARRFGLDPDRRWIFFPENFRWAFLSDEKLRSMTELGVDFADLDAQRDYCRDSLTAISQWLAAAARDGAECILRPRPAVNSEMLRSFVVNAVGTQPERLQIIKDLSVREWIFASDLVTSSISTALIEAAVAGKPVVRTAPCKTPPSIWYDWCALVPSVEFEDAFLASSLGALDAASGAALRKWASDSFKLGEAPTDSIAQHLAALADKADENPAPIATPADRPPGWMEAALRIANPRQRHRLRLAFEPNYFFNYETHEKDLFGDKEWRRRARRWRRILAMQNRARSP